MSRHKAEEARKGLFDSVAGKAKEVAGAVIGKDDLVEEGQLQQAGAVHRKAAAAAEAVAAFALCRPCATAARTLPGVVCWVYRCAGRSWPQ